MPPESQTPPIPSSAKSDAPRRPAIRSIQDLVLSREAPTLQAMRARLRSPSRERELVEQRHIAMWLARRCGHRLDVIGREFGGRDHATVFSAVRRVDRRIAEDPAFAARVARLARSDPGSPP